MLLGVLCVTVKTPSTGPASLPSLVAAIDTVAASPSAIMIEAVSAGAAAIVTAGLPVPVSATTTVSSPSTSASATMPVTSIVTVVLPAGIVAVPLRAL